MTPICGSGSASSVTLGPQSDSSVRSAGRAVSLLAMRVGQPIKRDRLISWTARERVCAKTQEMRTMSMICHQSRRLISASTTGMAVKVSWKCIRRAASSKRRVNAPWDRCADRVAERLES